MVTVTGNTSADQVIVANGAILEHFSGTFTIDDGVGHDIDVRGGGVFLLSGASTSPGFSVPAARINIDTGGILRISAGGLTGIGTGVNANNYIYQHQSILEWTLGAGFSFSTSGVTYFPNAGALTIPIFRTTNPTAINVGGNSFTRINGVFECNGATVNWINTGLKVFRNGIRGPGTMNGLASGKFFIDGVSAELGGTGAFLLPTLGMDVGPNTLITLTSDKTLTGEITLQPNSYIEPGIFDLTVTGTVTGGSATSFVRTLGTGKLTLSNVGASGKTFAIGNLTYNPVFISNILTGEIADFSARVENGINPAISNPAYAVLRTWNITSAETLNDVTLSFGYFAGDGGALFNYTNSLEAAAYINGTWNIVQSGIIPLGTYQAIVSPVDVFNAGLEIPFVLGNLGSILSVNYFITANAQKINGSASIRWKVLETENVHSYQVERSPYNQDHTTIATIVPVAGQLEYIHKDANLGSGIFLYRIRVNHKSGQTRYSNTVAIVSAGSGILITSLAPNPVAHSAVISLSSASYGGAYFEIADIAGRTVKRWHSNVAEGTNIIYTDLSALPPGVYHLVASTIETKTGLRFVKR
jgi:hypothetical protein